MKLVKIKGLFSNILVTIPLFTLVYLDFKDIPKVNSGFKSIMKNSLFSFIDSAYNFLILVVASHFSFLVSTANIHTKLLLPDFNRGDTRSLKKTVNVFIVDEIERYNHNEQMSCQICEKYMPERASHCEECNVCYLKRHYHSSFFWCCIHFYNYKSYIMLMISTMLFLIIGLVQIIIIHSFEKFKEQYIVTEFFFSFLIIILLPNFIIELKMLVHNETHYENKSIKYFKKGNVMLSDAFRYEMVLDHNSVTRDKINVYNLGKRKNIREILEFSLRGILLPFPPNGKTGINFERNSNFE